VSAAGQPLEAWFRDGVAAARSGQRARARDLLRRVVEADKDHYQAWLWLAGVAEGEEQAACAARVRALSAYGDGFAAAAVASASEVVARGAEAAALPPAAEQQAAPGVAQQVAPGVAQQVAPGVAQQVAPGVAQQVAPGVAQQVAPGVAQQVAPGPALPSAQEQEARAVQGAVLAALLEAAWPGLAALAILGGIALAELAVTLVDPRLGLVLHFLMLVLLVVQVALGEPGPLRGLFLGLTLVPLIRILSLSLPLAHFLPLYWYLLTSVPLFVAAWVAGRALGYSWRALGLTLRGWPLQLAVGLTGLGLGALEYAILQPAPLAPALTWAGIWLPALILLICTGLLEEMIFRGLLQRAAGDALGRWGMPYVALLFAVMHLGYRSLLDVAFVFVVGLYFGVVVQRTRSLLGVTLAHGLTNILLFLVMPFVAA
jgi:hypothetical protein